MKATKQLIQTIEDIFNDYRNSELFEAKANACADASLFMGEMLDKTDNLTEAIGDGLRELADAVRELATSVAQIGGALAQKVAQKVEQKKEASPSSPLAPPKDEEERTKEGEENNPPIIPPSSPEENCSQESRAREEIEQYEKSFNEFWNAYNYKRGKPNAKEAWKKLSKKDRKAALEGLAAYKADCERFSRQMCWASTYLHQRRWEDDFTTGLENVERINGKRNIITREDIRRQEQQQRLQSYASLAEEFRGQGGN